MKKITFCLGVILILAMFAQAQADEDRVVALMKKHNREFCTSPNVQVWAERVRVGPGKAGFIGACTYGGGPRLLFKSWRRF